MSTVQALCRTKIFCSKLRFWFGRLSIFIPWFFSDTWELNGPNFRAKTGENWDIDFDFAYLCLSHSRDAHLLFRSTFYAQCSCSISLSVHSCWAIFHELFARAPRTIPHFFQRANRNLFIVEISIFEIIEPSDRRLLMWNTARVCMKCYSNGPPIYCWVRIYRMHAIVMQIERKGDNAK